MASTKVISKVTFVIAMEQEAAPFIERLSLAKTAEGLPHLPAVVHQGTYKDLSVTIVTSGKHKVFDVDCAGTVGAALTTYAAIQAFSPDLLVNAGTAGGFQAKGGAVGDTYVITAVCNHDRRIPIPGFDTYGIGKLDVLPTANLVKSTGWKTGLASTGNSLDFVEKDKEIWTANDASVKEMECAAIADVAQSCGVPFFAIKVLTDIVDGEKATQEEFMQNLGKAAASLQESLPQLLDFLVGKTIDEL